MLILRRDVAIINNADVPGASLASCLTSLYCQGSTGYKLWDGDNTQCGAQSV